VLPAADLIYWSIEAGEAWVVHIRDARRRPWTADRQEAQKVKCASRFMVQIALLSGGGCFASSDKQINTFAA
jgi:hypothetical protein